MVWFGHKTLECPGSLSWALQNLSKLSVAKYSGAAGANLLQTATGPDWPTHQRNVDCVVVCIVQLDAHCRCSQHVSPLK